MNTLNDLRAEIKKIANPEKAKALQRFFKTGNGEYAEGDTFVGLMVPQSRILAKKYKELSDKDLIALLHSPIHEERLIALFIFIEKFSKGTPETQKRIYDIYLSNTRYINNWDLIDLSSSRIVGAYLSDKPKDILTKLAHSDNLWERRIAMLATLYFIKQHNFEETLKIAEILLYDRHDLIHKAVGWLLREVGKLSRETEVKFLKKHYKTMPRTMLRYAIEHFPEEKRKRYLRGEI